MARPNGPIKAECFICGRPLVIPADDTRFEDDFDIYHVDCADLDKACVERDWTDDDIEEEEG